jgi:aspartyl-tRNA(Asn)/glutamyl-tRNA(Gln) amidotransferase subunit A
MLEVLEDPDTTMMDPGLIALARRGARVSATGYLRAETGKHALHEELSDLFLSVDFLVAPTVGIEPFAAGADVPAGWADPDWWSWAAFTYLLNLTGHPAVSVPVPAADRCPFGVQVIGGYDEDEQLLAWAAGLTGMLRSGASRRRS